MPVAEDFHDLGGDLFAWSAFSPAAKVELSAHALVLPAAGSAANGAGNAARIVVFVDPVALRRAALEELLLAAEATPAAVLITNGNHARAAADFRRRLRVPVLAAAEARAALREDGLEIDGEIPAAAGVASPVSPDFPDAPRLFFGGETSALQAIALPGFAAGETAFYFAADGGTTLLVGDALIHLEPPYDFVPLPKKYCTAPKETPAALRRLLDLPRFERMTFAHGTPLLAGARERLAALLAAGGGQAS